MTETKKTKIEKLAELVSVGLEGRVVTVTPVNDEGYNLTPYKGVFVRWARGYNRVDLPMPTPTPDPETGEITNTTTMVPTLGEIDDAIVMRESGRLEIAGVRTLKFEL